MDHNKLTLLVVTGQDSCGYQHPTWGGGEHIINICSSNFWMLGNYYQIPLEDAVGVIPVEGAGMHGGEAKFCIRVTRDKLSSTDSPSSPGKLYLLFARREDVEWAGEGREEELLDDNLWSLEERAEAEREVKHTNTNTENCSGHYCSLHAHI